MVENEHDLVLLSEGYASSRISVSPTFKCIRCKKVYGVEANPDSENHGKLIELEFVKEE